MAKIDDETSKLQNRNDRDLFGVSKQTSGGRTLIPRLQNRRMPSYMCYYHMIFGNLSQCQIPCSWQLQPTRYDHKEAITLDYVILSGVQSSIISGRQAVFFIKLRLSGKKADCLIDLRILKYRARPKYIANIQQNQVTNNSYFHGEKKLIFTWATIKVYLQGYLYNYIGRLSIKTNPWADNMSANKVTTSNCYNSL